MFVFTRFFNRFKRFVYAIGFASLISFVTFASFACETNEFDFEGTCIENKFRVTTTKTNSFSVKITAKGTFYIDWGDGTVEKKEKEATEQTYSHTYSTSEVHTIKFGGQATKYITSSDKAPAIGFNVKYTSGGDENVKKLASIEGSLGKMFPTIDDTRDSGQPRFYWAFHGASNLTGEIPADLFDGIYGQPVTNMFNGTFNGCSKLESTIPEGLFSGISGKPVSYMFANTFVGCGKLYGSIPQDLFSGISGEPAPSMFAGTFYNCKGLSGEIPAGLFEKISGAPAEKMFINTFYGCADLTSYIPYGLFSGITGTRATSDFSGTTSGANLDTICPENTYQATINTNPSFNSLDGHPICAPCPDGTTSSAGSTSIEQCFLSSYNIIYDYTNGGSGCANDTYTPGTAKELLCIPTKEGYTFAGWYDAATGGNKIETITILDTGNKTLYAQWRNILCPEGWTSDDDIITDINTQCYQMCSVACIEQACPENASCTNGDEKSSGKKYYGDEETCNAESIECSLDITCNTGYAKTTEDICELKEYTITYELSGGNNSESNPSTYTIESSEITLSSPTKEGYEFVGWYDNSGFTGDQITVIPQGSFGNRTYYAQWKTSLCDLGEYRQDDECLICPENKYCPGDNTVTECPQGLVAPQGNTSIDNCGKIFNIDGEMLYLTQTRQTLPALAVSLGENVYYGKMRPVSQGLTPIHKDTEVYFKANVSGTEYYIYDNTIGE